tara:strand:+ start:588 stop:770 length:183 start_codon:yes stop_codon:yes gene_type:complete
MVSKEVWVAKGVVENAINLKLPGIIENGFGTLTVEVSVQNGQIVHSTVSTKETQKMARKD